MSLPLSDAAPARTRVAVELGARRYDVLIGPGLVREAGALLAREHPVRRAIIVTDAVVAEHHLAALRDGLGAIVRAVHVVPAGEASKSWPVLIETVEAILAAGLERGDAVIALGGGVVGDLAGFAAAVARRGMPFVQIPTTLLAQVDSAVGGKTGINSAHGKNLVGAFHQPSLVLADTGTLATLPDRQRRAGYAEIVKIGLINDAAFFARLEALGSRAPRRDVEDTIATAVAAKAAVVVADEREAGQRALLNLGHTFAHAVERTAGYDGRVIHGEAVALGLCLAFRLSARLGLAPQKDAERVAAHLAAAGLPTTFSEVPVQCTMAGLTAAMAQDKKVKDGIVRFVLVSGIGGAFVSDGVAPDALADFLRSEGLPSS